MDMGHWCDENRQDKNGIIQKRMTAKSTTTTTTTTTTHTHTHTHTEETRPELGSKMIQRESV
jgi:hypothetical protein